MTDFAATLSRLSAKYVPASRPAALPTHSIRLDAPVAAQPDVLPHPAEGSRFNRACPYAWEFQCQHRERGKNGGQCARVRRVCCNGGPHQSLDAAVQATLAFGWALEQAAHPLGWRCLAHREEP